MPCPALPECAIFPQTDSLPPSTHLPHPVPHHREFLVVLVAAQQVEGQPKVLLHIACGGQRGAGSASLHADAPAKIPLRVGCGRQNGGSALISCMSEAHLEVATPFIQRCQRRELQQGSAASAGAAKPLPPVNSTHRRRRGRASPPPPRSPPPARCGCRGTRVLTQGRWLRWAAAAGPGRPEGLAPGRAGRGSGKSGG